jgi:hypothetical protein
MAMDEESRICNSRSVLSDCLSKSSCFCGIEKVVMMMVFVVAFFLVFSFGQKMD